MRFRNLTPHPVRLVGENQETTLQPEVPIEKVPRVEEKIFPTGKIRVHGVIIPVKERKMGKTINLPDREEGTFLIVPALISERENRDDLLSPGDQIRDEKGRVVGAGSLVRPQPNHYPDSRSTFDSEVVE